MSASLGSIYVDLLARTSKFDEGMRNSTRSVSSATSSWNKSFSSAKSGFGQVDASVQAVTTSVLSLAGAAAGVLSAREVIRYSDTWKNLESRLSLATKSGEQMAQVQQRLFDIAQETSTPLASNIDGYTRLSNSLNEAQKSHFDLVRISELLSKTLALSGADATAAATFYQQFGQAASSDFKAIGQELQTFADQNPRFYKILRDEAEKYGKNLKAMAKDGELSFSFVAQALLNSGQVIDKESESIANTVGRALTKLDNAFLQYIGQSSAVSEGTSSIAIGISALAGNFDLLASAVTIAAGAFGVRLVASLAGTAAGFISTSTAALAFNVAIGRVAFGSTAAAVAMTGLATAGRGAVALMAAFGGPIGIAALAALTAFTLHTNQAVDAEQRYTKILGEVVQGYANYSTASAENRKKIDGDAAARIASITREKEELEKLVLGYASLSNEGFMGVVNGLGVGILEGAGKLGIGQAPSEVLAQYEAAQKALEDYQKARRDAQNPKPSLATGGGGLSDKELKKLERERLKAEKELGDLYKQNETYITGLDEKTIKYGETMDELSKLVDKGKISQEQYYTALGNLDAEYDKATEKASLWAVDVEAATKRAAENVQDSLADFLFDPFKDGLDGMLEGFINVIHRMVAEAAAAKILKNLFGNGAGEGLLGGITGGVSDFFKGASAATKSGGLGSFLWDALPKFDTGIDTVPRDMAAIIHQDEAVLNKQDAAAWRSGKGGGGGVVVNVINNAGAEVRTSSSQGPNGTELKLMIDQAMADNIAKPGSRTNQALSALQGRTLVRR